MSDIEFVGTLAFALSAGVATFFAPCAYPLLPGYVGYYASQREDAGSPRALANGLAAAGGAIAVFAAIGAVIFAVGQTVVADIALLEPVIGLGLVALGALTLTGNAPEFRILLPERPSSALEFGLFGGVYAVAAAGCVVPIFVGVVGQALALPPVRGALAFGAYALSVALPLVGVTLLVSAGIEVWRALGRYTGAIRSVAAGIMILAGLGQLYLSVVVLGVG